jgi:hypothetical protein
VNTELTNFLDVSKVQRRQEVGVRGQKGYIAGYSSTALPKVIADRFNLKQGDELFWYDQEGQMSVPSGIAESYDWLHVAIKRKVPE